MALSFKIIGGDAPKQKIIIRPRVRIRGLGVVILNRDILSFRLLGSQRKNTTAEIVFVNNKSVVVQSTHRAASELSVFAKQAEMSRNIQTTSAGYRKQKRSGFRLLLHFALLFLGTGFVLVLCLIGVAMIFGNPGTHTLNAKQVENSDTNPANESAKKRIESTKTSAKATVQIPEYSLIRTDHTPPIKAVFEIRLNEKVSESDIEDLAYFFRSTLKSKFDRIFILYYLPDMTVGSGAWATSHFNPNLDVKIIGMTQAEEDELFNKSAEVDNSSNRIGFWIDNTPFIASSIELIDQNGTIRLRQKFKDGRCQWNEY